MLSQDKRSNVPTEASSKPEMRVAIVGGGPGGLFTAWHLAAKAGTACKITIFEASDRLGGKIVTGNFAGAGLYEAGVAEIYDYSALGPDPLRELIEKDLGLEIKHIEGGPCILDGKVLTNADALAEHFGSETRDAAVAFKEKCAALLSPHDFYKSVRDADNTHPWAQVSGEEILATEITDEAARRYIRTMAHSDVAAPPHLTNGLNFLKNVLMDVDGYLDIFSVVGGNEEIVRRLVDDLDADIELNAPVRALEPLADGTYRLDVGSNGSRRDVIADFVVLALPLTALSIINWRSAKLQQAMARHINYFDRPGHYLRATLLFERPFWHEHLQSAWWMVDSFDGCAVYDEGARHDLGGWGALGFLIGGNAALGLANMSDEYIEQLCLDALPPCLEHGRQLLIDSRVHRWMASVNAIPGGFPIRPRLQNHQPDAARLPGVLVVGDYMFDATLNGVLDSADVATDVILADILARRRTARAEGSGTPGADPRLSGPSEEVGERFFEAQFLADLFKITWDLKLGARILIIGSGSGRTIASLRAAGFDAIGIEQNRQAVMRTPAELRAYNLVGEFTDLPFPADDFDVVVETGLCQLPREKVERACAEMRRVAKRGVVLGSVTTDLSIDLIERYDLLSGVKTLSSRWDWSEKLYTHGFDHALSDPARLAEAWKRAEAAGAGLGHWYEDAESLLYCIYEKGPQCPAADAAPVAAKAIAGQAYHVERVPTAAPHAVRLPA